MVSSVPRHGLHPFSKPTFKSKDWRIFLSIFSRNSKSVFGGSFQETAMHQIVLKTTSFSSLNEERKVGCEKFEAKNVHKSKDRTHMRMWKQSCIKSYGTSTGCYALHGKRSKRGNKDKGQEMKVPRRWVLMVRIWQYVEVVKVTWISFLRYSVL